MNIKFNVVGFIDRRGPRELEAARYIQQQRTDAAIERLWRERVRQNFKEIRRVTR